MDGFLRSARNTSLVASGAIAVVGVVAGAVRLLPWLLDPTVPLGVAAPFARGLLAVALEAAIFVGWPVGCALACFAFVERGEARVLQSLGERPLTTVVRLAPQGLALAALLGIVARVAGGDASGPGRVATELLSTARRSCARATGPTTYAIPFTDLTWLCAPSREPLLVGSPAGVLSSAVVTARDARIAGDFRAAELYDARLLFAEPTAGTASGATGKTSPGSVAVHVDTLSLRRMPPWARASTLPPWLRAVLFSLAAWLAAWLAAYAVLRRSARTRLAAIVLGASGPLAALGAVRMLEQASAPAAAFAVVPAVCAAASTVAATLMPRLRLPWHTASKTEGVR